MPSINDYTEIEDLGNGAFGIFFNLIGHVFLVSKLGENKFYAMKKILLNDGKNNEEINNKRIEKLENEIGV